jgi:hypothetical protein
MYLKMSLNYSRIDQLVTVNSIFHIQKSYPNNFSLSFYVLCPLTISPCDMFDGFYFYRYPLKVSFCEVKEFVRSCAKTRFPDCAIRCQK